MAKNRYTVLPDYFFAQIRLWRGNGVSIFSIAINALFLAIAWLLLPLETHPWRGIAEHFSQYFPQINPRAPRPGDPVRVLIQALYLLVVRFKPREGLFRRRLMALSLASHAKLQRLTHQINRWGTPLMQGYSRRITTGTSARFTLAKPLRWLLIAILGTSAAALAILCITQPFDVQGQVIFLGLMLTLALVLIQIQARIALMLLFVISIVVSGRYLWWRCTATIHDDSFATLFFAILLLGAEIYAFIVMFLGYFQVCWVLDRQPYPIPEDPTKLPSVDIFIPTYNESLEVIKPTVFAALNLKWPAEKLNVYILDDGSRDFIEDFAKSVGAGYIKRIEHNHAKAGNINHALTLTDGEFVTIFDCDHVPSCDFLEKTMGWLIKDGNIALVQTPHHFYSPDPFEKNLHLERTMPIENALFHDFIQKGNDTWNATMFCGSSAVMRRCALEEVGGIAVETVTEDAHTSLKLNRRGWSSAFISTPLASGLSTDTLAAHIGQRIRWARGMIQIFRLDNPFLRKGLTFPQRLCFFNAMFHFLHGLPRLIFLAAPLPYMFADIHIIYATAAAIFAYVLPHMIHSMITNYKLQRGYRYPFLGAVYETVLAWYILLPTTIALFMPHKGKFNVTAKGESIDKKYLEWSITKPYLFFIALNAVALGIGLYKALFAPDPQYVTLVINVGWIFYNLVILGATMATAVEEVQKHRLPRIPLAVPATITLTTGAQLQAQLIEYSQEALRLKVEATIASLIKDHATFTVTIADGQTVATAPVQRNSVDHEGFVEVTLAFTSLDEERAFNRVTFSREGMWAMPQGAAPDDSLWAGFARLHRLALYGYVSMIEFLPQPLQWIHTGCRWLATYWPRATKF